MLGQGNLCLLNKAICFLGRNREYAFGHKYFSAEKSRDPASAPSCLRLSIPVRKQGHLLARGHKKRYAYFVSSAGIEPAITP
jgi:hypothetical protein